ncbi:MAG: tetratricopeptide repeat protein [Terracidiphilus sp.]|nr:tetratricopeptide repeat protein [Terracidiphilus sp.]
MKSVLQAGIVLGLVLAAVHCVGQSSAAVNQQRQAALALEQQGRNAEAETAWRAYLKAFPLSPEPYAHLGLLEARQEHYKEAAPLYRKALEIGPEVPGLRMNLGLALFKGGDLKQAIVEFSQLAKNQPGNQQLMTLIGMAHYGLAEYAEAVPYLKSAADNDAKNLPLRLALAHSCLWSKQLQCVMDVYHEILTLDPESAEADMLAGEALDELKDNAGAIKMFREAVKANPKEPNAHFGLGYLLWTLKQYKEAASEFQAELVNDPDHVQAMLYLADTEIQTNQMDTARTRLEKAVKLAPEVGLGHLDLGIIYSEDGRNDEALRELTLAAKIIPDEVSVHWRLGRLYRTLGRKEEAKAEFDKASSLNKAVDEELYRKIDKGRDRPAPAPSSATPNQ